MVEMNLKTTISYLFLSCIWIFPLYGDSEIKIDEDQPVLYYADSQTYDRELGILILKGHVEFDHQGTILEADYVTYNEATDVVTASGNVRLRQLNGEINFAEYMELTGDMKEGIVLQLRTLLEDDSKIAALEARKFENHEELDQVVYTPCKLCGSMPPSWQINARHAIKDNVGENIHFIDSEFRLFDVPLFYTPYATQPLKRRSGFLIPKPSYSQDLGWGASVPYYFAPYEEIDFTLTPVFFSEKNPLFWGQYRQAFSNGGIQIDGSITKYRLSAKEKKAIAKKEYELPKVRGHFFAAGKFKLNETWALKAEGGYVRDNTYLRKYKITGFQSTPALTSKAILEGFLNSRDYAAAKVYYFQGLRDQNHQKRIPQALPLLEYSAYSGVDPWGGRFKFDGNFLNIYRENGINYQRGVGEVGWQRPWIIPLGQVLTAFGSARGDIYKVENLRNRPSKNPRNRPPQNPRNRPSQGKMGGSRFFPQTGLDWRWPFVNSWEKQNFVLQPSSKFIVSPNKPIGAEADHIPNEDSTDFEFNDANLFSSDRLPGYDRIDTGSRVVYGGEVLSTGALFGDVNIFLGQSYSLSKPQFKSNHQGLKYRSSDYVGRVEASPWSWLTLNYRFRLDEKTRATRLTELGGSIGPAIAKLAGDYVFISRHAGTPNRKDFKQLFLSLSSNFTQYWTVMATMRQNINKKKEGGGPLQRGIGFLYRDDCFGLGLTINRQYYRAKDVQPTTIYLVTFWLKGVGNYGYSYNPTAANGAILGDRVPNKF
jgi:LPS-assembly protein